MKVFYGGLAMCRGRRKTGMLRGSMSGSVQVFAQWVGRGKDGLIPKTA